MKELEDKLRRLDFDAAFPGTPESIPLAVVRAGRKIRARRRYARLMLCAAALLIAAGTLPLIRRGGARDVALVQTSAGKSGKVVWTSQKDEFYHARADCEDVLAGAVSMQEISALEFQKTICPKCGKEE